MSYFAYFGSNGPFLQSQGHHLLLLAASELVILTMNAQTPWVNLWYMRQQIYGNKLPQGLHKQHSLRPKYLCCPSFAHMPHVLHFPLAQLVWNSNQSIEHWIKNHIRSEWGWFSLTSWCSVPECIFKHPIWENKVKGFLQGFDSQRKPWPHS